MGVRLLRARPVRRPCALDGRFNPDAGVGLDPLQLVLGGLLALGEQPSGADQGIAILPGRRLVLWLVRLRVALVMAVPAVGLRLDDDGTATAAAPLGRVE